MVHRGEENKIGVCDDGSVVASVPSLADANTRSAVHLNEQCGEAVSLSCSIKKEKGISIGLVDSHCFTRECLKEVLEILFDGVEITVFVSYEECLECAKILDVILYYNHDDIRTQCEEGQAFDKLETLSQTAPVIILSSADHRDLMMKAFESGARAFVPNATTTPQQLIEIIRFVKAGGTFVPASSLSPKSIGASSLTPSAMTTQFTPRELAVLEYLTLGKANKNIAFELKMSESTVKVHIRSIMNKLKATNRTEVVCRAFDLGRVGVLARREA